MLTIGGVMKKILVAVLSLFLVACQQNQTVKNEKIKIVSTTSIIGDIVKSIAQDKVEQHILIDVGLDPHGYEAKTQDIEKINAADVVLYTGLNLEAKMSDVFEKLSGKNKKVIAVTESIKDSPQLIKVQEDGQEVVDPHYWFDIDLFQKSVDSVYKVLVENDSKNKEFYSTNYKKYTQELTELKKESTEKMKLIPETSRYLITPHDAFQYFARANGIEVKSLQGVSTESEISTKDVLSLVDFIYNNKVKAIFVESTTPHKNIETVRESLKVKGFEVKLGEELYSDSLSDEKGNADTYIKMYKHNVNAIVEALK